MVIPRPQPAELVLGPRIVPPIVPAVGRAGACGRLALTFAGKPRKWAVRAAVRRLHAANEHEIPEFVFAEVLVPDAKGEHDASEQEVRSVGVRVGPGQALNGRIAVLDHVEPAQIQLASTGKFLLQLAN